MLGWAGRCIWSPRATATTDRHVRSRDAGGFGLAAVWADELHHALHTALTGERSGYYSTFDGLADLERGLRASRRAAPCDPGWRFVTALQNHDQIGNRARGERLHHLVGLDHTLAAAAIVLCAPTVPLLFQGEEWASGRPFPYFTDHEDPVLARAVSEGRRREFAEFGWNPDEILDPQDPTTFEIAVLDWTVVDEDAHGRAFRWYQDLIALRRSHPDLTDGDRQVMEVDAEPRPGRHAFGEVQSPSSPTSARSRSRFRQTVRFICDPMRLRSSRSATAACGSRPDQQRSCSSDERRP